MTGTTPVRAALLARVSRDEQKRYGYSLDDQIGRGRAHCAERGYALDNTLIFQSDQSGKKPIEQRALLQSLIAAIMAGRVDVVVC